MAFFNDMSQVKTFKVYKAAMKTALGKVKAGTPVKFVYLEKFPFDDKERVLVLIDYEPELVAQLGKKPAATGKCSVNEADKLVFTASGSMSIDKVIKLFAEVGVARAVAHPDDEPDAPSREPVGSKLNMKHGWTEVRKWGAEAQDLIDAFDGLVGVYKGLPAIRPEWKDLSARHEQVKADMGEMVRAEIVNDKQAREAQLAKVQALVKVVRKLASDIRDQASLASEPERTVAPKPAAKQPPRETPTVSVDVSPTDPVASRKADEVTALYETLQKKFGPVYETARRLNLPTDALTTAENAIEKLLKQSSQTIVGQLGTLKQLILEYGQLGKAMVEANVARQRELDEQARLEELARQQEAARLEKARLEEQARQQELARQEKARLEEQARQQEAARLEKARLEEQARQQELARQEKARLEEQARQQEAARLEKARLEEQARQQELARQEKARLEEQARQEEAARQEKERLEAQARQQEARRREEERDLAMTQGTRKKKVGPKAESRTDPSPQAPTRTAKKKAKFVPLDMGAPMTFKEKFAEGMVQQVGDVEKKVTSFDKDGGFSTFYKFSQGDSDEPVYEIHVHRKANGRFLSGQVKFGHLAKVVRGGEEPLAAKELATYRIPAKETAP